MTMLKVQILNEYVYIKDNRKYSEDNTIALVKHLAI